MKRFLIGAVLSLMSVSTFAAASKTLLCESDRGVQHHIITSGTEVQFNGETFSFFESGTMANGSDVYLFKNTKKSKFMAVAQSGNVMVYQVRDLNKKMLASGICE